MLAQSTGIVLFLPSSGAAPTNVFTQVQLVSAGGGCSGSSNTCSISVSAIGSGHVGIILWSLGSQETLAGVSGGGSWTIPGGCTISNVTVGASAGCAYILNTTSGATTVAVTWSGSSPGFPVTFVFYELSYTGPTPTLDTGSSGGLGTIPNLTFSATQPGVGLTVSGANLAIFQVEALTSGAFSSISGGYTGSDNNQFNNGMAHLYNTVSGASPTWTNTLSSNQVGAAIAIQ